MAVTEKKESLSSPQSWQRVRSGDSPFQQVSRLVRKVKVGKWLAGGALILVLGGLYYSSHRVGGQAGGPRITVAPVRVAKVVRRNMPVVERTIGTVVANDAVQVTAQVPGLIQDVFFKEGQMVKKGDLLFQIDPRPFEAAAGQANGQLTKDQATLDGAKRDLKRYQTLLAADAESQQVVDDQEATVRPSGTVEADQANLQTAQINLRYAKIRAPVDGQTGPITIMPGNIISVTGTTASVTPLVTINQIQPIKVSFFLPQTDLPRIQARRKNGGLVATIDQSDTGGISLTVPVSFVSNVVNITTGTIELRAIYDNTDSSLVPGQLVNVVVELSDIPKATVVPHDALAAGTDGQYVYKVVDGRAQQVAVNVLFDDSKNVAVQGDLRPGDDVVVDGQLEVVPGGAVEVVRGAQAGIGGRNAGTRPPPWRWKVRRQMVSISRRFIQYPVMTTLLMAALVIFGIFGYISLPVSELPNVDFPTIQVNASLAGADPMTMASTIATPLESSFAVIPGITQMTSSSTQGSTSISLQFDLDKNLGDAANDVQSAISRAQHQLPRTIISPPSYNKVNPTELPIVSIALSSKTLPITTVDKYAEELLARRISTLAGVAQVNVNGSQQYAVRIQADPGKLAARNMGIDALASAIATTNIDEATGALNDQGDAHIIHTDGQLVSADAFRHQIVTYQNGAPVRIGDVADVLDSSNDTRSGSWVGDERAIVLQVNRQPGSNTIDVVDNIKKVLPQFRAILPPSIKLQIMYDRTQTIRASVDDVQNTLLIAAVLVVLVIFIFLRKATATIIPSLALPIALIGTFAGMAMMGYSIDNLSLMALTLSVGFVVDDAIVMLENIVRHIEGGEKPYEAAMNGSAEIGFTILSMTLSLAAVFIPLVFMGGIVGRLLHEFSVTIILAIVFSGIISVTLTPMLCARFLKDEHKEKHNYFYNLSETAFNRVQAAYDRSLQWSMAHKRTIFATFLLSLVASVVLFAIMPEDFLPTDDIGQLQVSLLANEGTSYTRMVADSLYVQKIISADPNVYLTNPKVGGGGLGSSGAYTAQIQTYLKPRNERALSADEIARELRRKLTGIPGVEIFIVNPPTIRIGARQSRSSYQYTLEGLDLTQLRTVSTQLETALREMPGFVGVSSDFDKPAPSVEVSILRERAAALGVTPTQIENALSYAFGGQQVSQIYGSQNLYIVVLELLPRDQRQAEALRNLYVTSSNGTLVPLSAVTKVTSSLIPVVVNHQGELPAVTISFDLAAGYALSDAVSGIAKVSKDIGVPDWIQGNFQGTAAAFQDSTQNMGELLFIAIIVVYIILGILYESFIHPLTILSGLPSAAVGALLTLYLVGLPLTLYAFVGMIMLIGIVKKNAIMMIDFALQRERGKDGASPEQAIVEAAMIRFRPIMMTTMAALMGTLPIVFGVGMGSESRRPLGLCVAGGLLFSQALTLYITPVIYVYLDQMGTWFSNWRSSLGRSDHVPAE